MQRRPHGPRLVRRKLDEMISAAERAEGEAPVLIDRIVVASGAVFELADTDSGSVGDRAVVLARAHGDAPLEAGPDAGGILDVLAPERCFHRNHAAADVDPDGGWNDGALCRENGSD